MFITLLKIFSNANAAPENDTTHKEASSEEESEPESDVQLDMEGTSLHICIV